MDTLLHDVHESLEAPGGNTHYVKSDVVFYHYGCDQVDDRGWGCGYRTLQSICSWVKLQKEGSSKVPSQDEKKTGPSNVRNVPTLREIQQALVTMEDKRPDFAGSKEWIGSFEICLCLDYFYEVPCKIIHVTTGSQLKDHLDTLANHFEEFGSPVMMGGDTDNASKGILGVCKEPPALLVMDPHYYGKSPSKEQLQGDGFVTWRTLDKFVQESFYNFCLPQCKCIQSDISSCT